jgi:hypothetical protein
MPGQAIVTRASPPSPAALSCISGGPWTSHSSGLLHHPWPPAGVVDSALSLRAESRICGALQTSPVSGSREAPPSWATWGWPAQSLPLGGLGREQCRSTLDQWPCPSPATPTPAPSSPKSDTAGGWSTAIRVRPHTAPSRRPSRGGGTRPGTTARTAGLGLS